MRGRQEEVTIHTPRAPAGPVAALLAQELALWQQALDDWQACRLRPFAQKLHALRAIRPDFEPYAIYASRLQTRLAENPPAAERCQA